MNEVIPMRNSIFLDAKNILRGQEKIFIQIAAKDLDWFAIDLVSLSYA